PALVPAVAPGRRDGADPGAGGGRARARARARPDQKRRCATGLIRSTGKRAARRWRYPPAEVAACDPTGFSRPEEEVLRCASGNPPGLRPGLTPLGGVLAAKPTTTYRIRDISH